MRFLRPRRAAVAVPVTVLVLILVVALTGSAAYAVDPLPPDLTGGAGGLAVSTNLLWICIGGALVMLMQGGFALVETGFTRKKNAAHTMGMNVAIFGTAFVAFFVIGYPLMFGGYALPHVFGYDTAVGSGLVGSGN
ncbi:MAG: ammonium transporter, Amt family [Actinomycetota bacterium]|nr:ammonium transporter, Amt family [Actinomycetota bacterium]